MSAPVAISGLSELAARYDVLLCDVWGVIHNGRESFPVPCAALTRFAAEVGPVVLITNSPRPSPQVIEQLAHLKVPDGAWTSIVTSGDATRVLLGERAPGPAWAIGPERDGALYEGLGLEFAGQDTARFISVTGPYDDDVETPEDYRARFQDAVDRDLELICANPDLVVHRGEKLIYCGGALAKLYEEMGGKVTMAGKPHPAIYATALARASEHLGRPVDPARVLCIGDGLPTDVRGANAQGLDVLFIAAGIHGADLLAGDGVNLPAVERLLDSQGLSATWVMGDLDW